jgi:hypothetical protein
MMIVEMHLLVVCIIMLLSAGVIIVSDLALVGAEST